MAEPTPAHPTTPSRPPASLEGARLPLVAILRGIRPEEAVDVASALYEAGFRLIEVPLNSPRPLASIERIAHRFDDCLVGAGTVTRLQEVGDVRSAGGRLIVSPHLDATLVRAAIDAGLQALPGVATPTEAFAAVHAGARHIKVFPAEMVTPTVLKAWMAVLGEHAAFYPVGGISPESMAAFLAAGARGFGLGSALYRAGDEADAVGTRATRFVDAWDALHGRLKA